MQVGPQLLLVGRLAWWIRCRTFCPGGLEEAIFRLTRLLMDFAKLVEEFDEHGVSFVSVTQSFTRRTPWAG